MSKEKTLESAIQEFKNGIKQSDYVKLGAKGEYLTVPYRIKFFREYFGSRGQILTLVVKWPMALANLEQVYF